MNKDFDFLDNKYDGIKKHIETLHDDHGHTWETIRKLDGFGGSKEETLTFFSKISKYTGKITFKEWEEIVTRFEKNGETQKINMLGKHTKNEAKISIDPGSQWQQYKKKLKEKGFIKESAIQKILDREKISSTEIGNLVAIPHTIVEGDTKSIIGVAILENPIIWDKQEVQLVFMVFFNPKEKHNFSIFKYLYNFIKDEGGVRGIIKICDFKKLMTLIGD